MKKNLKNVCAKTLAAVLAMGMVVSASPASNASAAKKKPKLSVSKATITVGKTKKVTVKNAKAKKVTWTVNKKGKKIVKLSKKSKKGVTIKGVKAGKATVTAKIKVGKKNYKKTVKVTVVKKKTSPTKAPVTTAPVTTPPSSNTPQNSSEPPKSDTPNTDEPQKSDTPSTDEPTRPTKKPDSYVAQWPEITISEYNEATLTYGDTGIRDNLVWDEEKHTVKVTSMTQYNGGVALYLDPETQAGKDVSGYKYVAVTYESDKEMYIKMYDSDITETKGHTYDAAVQKYTGTDNIQKGVHTVYIDISDESDLLKDVGSIIANAKNDDPDTDEDGNKTQKPCDITLHSIKFTNEKADDGKGLASISLNAASGQVVSGSSVTVEATTATTGCAVKDIKWSVDNAKIAKVTPTADGKKATITGTSPGTAVVTATLTTTTGLTETAKYTLLVTSGQVINFDGTFDLSSPSIVASVNSFGAVTESACKVVKTKEGIEMYGNNMFKIDFSAYLAEAKINLSDYKKMTLAVDVYDLKGKVDYPSYEKVALCKKSQLDGYSDGLLNSQFKTLSAVELDLTDLREGAKLSDAIGINIQMNNLDNAADAEKNPGLGGKKNFSHITVKSITLTK